MQNTLIMEENEVLKKQDPDDEISLIDLFAVLWRRKALIIGISLAAAVLVVIASIISLVLPPEISFLPNEYTPKANMLINNPASSGGGGIASAISASGLGGLAGLAGVNVSGGATYSNLAKYLVTTNTFLDAVVDEFGLIERYKIEKFVRAASRKALKKKLLADYDQDSGVFTINFTDRDPAFAQRVVNYSVSYLSNWFKDLGLDKNVLQKVNYEQNIKNTYEEIRRLEEETHELDRAVSRGSGALPAVVLESRRLNLELSAQQEIYRQLKVQLEMTNVSIASEAPVFQVLELAEIPDQKSKPGRGMLCIIVTFAAFFFSVFLAFALNAVANIKQDPEAMAKLRVEKKRKNG